MEERLGFSHKEVGTHSIRSGFTMELYLAKVYPETIMMRTNSHTFFIKGVFVFTENAQNFPTTVGSSI